jgi:aryl-alcohol dehydrogenase-like predicted oxidoreductase
MDTRPLGRGGPLLSPIGFGAFKIGRNEKTKYGRHYELPDDAQATRLLNAVLNLGINYIDTAPAYGLSEARIGRTIGHRKQEFLVSTKVGETFTGGMSSYDFSRAAIEASVARSQQALGVDVLDLVFIHSPGDDLHVLHHTDAVETLDRLRESGAVARIGLSAKSPEGVLASLAWADAVMVEYHLLDRSHEQVIAAAADAGLGVVVKKGLAAGALPPDEAIRFVLANPAVSTMIIGTLSAEHLAENLRAFGG